MNKKYIKIIVSILIVVLLIGLGIFGYKKIKNRNNDSKVIENSNNIKAVDNLIELTTSVSIKSFTITKNNKTTYVYLFYKIYVQTLNDKPNISCTGKNNTPMVYNLFFEPYILLSNSAYTEADYINLYTSSSSIKLKSSWIIKKYESCYATTDDNFKSSMGYFIYYNSSVAKINDNYFVNSFSTNYTIKDTNQYTYDKDSFKYSKVYNIDTGDMVFEVPTNNLEIFDEKKYEAIAPGIKGDQTIPIYARTSYLRIGATAPANSVKDKVAVYNGDLYYLDTNYNNKELNGKQLLDIHKVSFGTNYTNQYNDTNLTQKDIELDDAGDTKTARNIYKVYATVTLNGES